MEKAVQAEKNDIYQTEEKTVCVFHQAYTLLIKAQEIHTKYFSYKIKNLGFNNNEPSA